MSERLFRVGDEVGYHDGGIPWRVIEPHAKQAIRNHSQSLERLHERGGLSWCEAAAVLEDRPWHKMDKDQARQRVLEIVAAMTPTPSTAEPSVARETLDDACKRVTAEAIADTQAEIADEFDRRFGGADDTFAAEPADVEQRARARSTS